MRRFGRWLLLAGFAEAVAVAFGMPPAAPVDAVLNLAPAPRFAGLSAPPGRHLVVLQHGLLRSSWSLWRLERALRAHGYEVCNRSYPSTGGSIAEHAATLAQGLAPCLATPPDSVAFVGHSLGGLVIRAYLSRADAVRAARCVFLGTPHRGAEVAARLHGRLWYRLLLGTAAAAELVPGDPIYRALAPLGCPAGNVVGGGDGRVAAAEARLPEEADAVDLPLGHTGLTTAADAIEQVLCFLRRGEFCR